MDDDQKEEVSKKWVQPSASARDRSESSQVLPTEDGEGDVFLKEARMANKLVHHCYFMVLMLVNYLLFL